MKTSKQVLFAFLVVFSAMTPSIGVCAQPALREGILVSTDWLEARLKNPDLVILHVITGTGDEYDRGHIPGALPFLWGDFVTERSGIPNEIPPIETLTALFRRLGIDSSDRIVIYDEERGMAAARAFVTFDFAGLGDRTALLDGQLAKWRKENRPLSTDIPETEESSIVLKPNPAAVMKSEKVKDLLSEEQSGSGVTFLDSRQPGQYTGKSKSGSVRKAGRLPGAINLPWELALVEGDLPVLRPEAELRRLIEDGGIEGREAVVTYCNTGRSASFNYFLLKYLGYDVHLYDGSMSEWTRKPDAPVELGDPKGEDGRKPD